MVKRENVRILAPITSCEKVLCIGMNYKDHCEEQNAPIPAEPVVFNKFPSCIIGPEDSLSYPGETEVYSDITESKLYITFELYILQMKHTES